MDLKKDFGTNKKLEEDGVWIDVGDNTQLKIARANNKKAQAYSKQIAKPYLAQIRFGKLPEEIYTKLAIEVAAECILLDWKNLEEDGIAIAYSKENAMRMLTDYSDFRDLVSSMAEERKTFQREVDEAVTKK
jgi:hypothetical protein